MCKTTRRKGGVAGDALMLAEMLRSRHVLLADGAMATNLFELGLTPGTAPEQWLEQYPERVAALHQQFVDAGADIILTNSFGANARRLQLCNLQHRARELNRIAALLARDVADKAARQVVVAGSVGPTGERFAPFGSLTEEGAVAVFVEQMQGLKAGGVDVLWIETMSALEEMRAAAQAAAHVGLPFTMTASIDTAGCTMTGVSPAALAAFFGDISSAPLAGGVNCGAGVSDTLAAVLSMTQARPDQIVIAKSNAGLPTLHGTCLHYACSPELMADYARLAIDAGARIIGGCCGASPAHIAAMRKAIDSHATGPLPTLGNIVARTGAFASPPRT
jgi:methionine synthase I (cobalamin-dependent)